MNIGNIHILSRDSNYLENYDEKNYGFIGSDYEATGTVFLNADFERVRGTLQEGY
jgi:hypothetical protein